jgi:hypothetical protein
MDPVTFLQDNTKGLFIAKITAFGREPRRASERSGVQAG